MYTISNRKLLLMVGLTVSILVVLLIGSQLSLEAEELKEESKPIFVLDDVTYEITGEDTVQIVGYTGTDEELLIHDVVYEDKAYRVKAIGDEAFKNNMVLTAVHFRTEIEVVGDKAFYECRNLRSIEFWPGLKEIGFNAFFKSGVVSVLLPESCVSVGDSAFIYCTSLYFLDIPPTVKKIGDLAFYGCRSLYKVFLHPDIDYGLCVFGGCVGLTSLGLPLGLDVVGDKYDPMFFGVDKLKEVHFQDSVYGTNKHGMSDKEYQSATPWGMSGKNLEIATFSGMILDIPSYLLNAPNSVKKLEIPDTVMEIGKKAFQGCTEATYIELPLRSFDVGSNTSILPVMKNLKELHFLKGGFKNIQYGNGTGFKLVYECSFWYKSGSLEKLVIEEGVKYIPAYLMSFCTNLKEVYMADSVTHIHEFAFQRCYALEHVRFSKNLEKIDYGAFKGTSLKKEDIPNIVGYTGSNAFEGCSLETIDLRWYADYIKTNSFNVGFHHKDQDPLSTTPKLLCSNRFAGTDGKLYLQRDWDSSRHGGCDTRR